jgi:alpha-D-ribose 1-methylphosphonate 5-triphosphate synthase subunit PhnI
MYVAVKGGEAAIAQAHTQLADMRRGDKHLPALSVAQIREQLPLAVARVMAEGSLYDQQLAALAIKQAAGDLQEAIFLLRAYRTTLPRFFVSRAIHTSQMQISRRISAIFKDLPGGQRLGPTFDYTHRLLDFSLLDDDNAAPEGTAPKSHGLDADVDDTSSDTRADMAPEVCPHVSGILADEGLIARDQPEDEPVPDITREPLDFPAGRARRLQALARGDEGFVLALGYSTQRGYGRNHPFAGEIRIGQVEVWADVPELPFAVPLGDIEVTECDMVNQFVGNAEHPPQFSRGYGLAFGYNERKAMGMALVDRALCAAEYGEDVESPAQHEGFVLMHCDNVEAAGFVSHLKLPHYVDFQSELDLIRTLRREHGQAASTCPADARRAIAEESA